MSRDLKSIPPSQALSYAVGSAINEAVARGLITSSAADWLMQRSDDFHKGLMMGKTLAKQPNGVYLLIDSTVEAKRDALETEGTLIIGDSDEN